MCSVLVRPVAALSAIAVAIVTERLWPFSHTKACYPAVQAQLTQMATNGSGVRDTTRVLHISRNTVSSQLKKKRQVMQVNPEYANEDLTVSHKVEEMWSFVCYKPFPQWLWWVEDAGSGEVIAFVLGRRTHATFRRLLALLKKAYIKVSGWITDAWSGPCLPTMIAWIKPCGWRIKPFCKVWNASI